MEMIKLNTEADALPARGNMTALQMPVAPLSLDETVVEIPVVRQTPHWDVYKKELRLFLQLFIAGLISVSVFYSIFMTGAKTSAEEKLQVLDRSAKQLFQLFGHPAIGAVSSEWTTNSTAS